MISYEVLCGLSTVHYSRKQTLIIVVVLFPQLHLVCFKIPMSRESKFSKKYLVLINFLKEKKQKQNRTQFWECHIVCGGQW